MKLWSVEIEQTRTCTLYVLAETREDAERIGEDQRPDSYEMKSDESVSCYGEITDWSRIAGEIVTSELDALDGIRVDEAMRRSCIMNASATAPVVYGDARQASLFADVAPKMLVVECETCGDDKPVVGGCVSCALGRISI